MEVEDKEIKTWLYDINGENGENQASLGENLCSGKVQKELSLGKR